MSAGNPDQKVHVYAVFSSLTLVPNSGHSWLLTVILRYYLDGGNRALVIGFQSSPILRPQKHYFLKAFRNPAFVFAGCLFRRVGAFPKVGVWEKPKQFVWNMPRATPTSFSEDKLLQNTERLGNENSARSVFLTEVVI